MTEQLNLLGDRAQPVDDELGPVQREVIRRLRELGNLSRPEAGQIVHHHRGKHGVDEVCMWCATDGALVLESLIRRGLVAWFDGTARLPQDGLQQRSEAARGQG